MIPLFLISACLTACAWGQEPASPTQPAQPTAPAPTVPAPPEQLLLEELREQAREDLAIWEARVKARTAWLKEATQRVETAKVFRDLNEKQVKVGNLSKAQQIQANLDIAEMEARREQKAVELTEAQAKVSRLKRRLAMLMKADKYDVLGTALGAGSPFQPSAAEDRIADLEQQIERLRSEMDETRQTARALRNESDRKSQSPQVNPR